MRNILYSLFLLGIFGLFSCSKSSTTPSESNGTTFSFTSLTAVDTIIKVNVLTTVNATATGSGLTYHWSASYGTIIGSGASVKWTACHEDVFTVTCKIDDDSGHSDSKTIRIHVGG
jgi:hypothetical protein